MICGLILAGGRSRRFGREKAMIELGGRPLIDWVAVALSPTDALAVSARPGSGAAVYASSRGRPVVHDAVVDNGGPLAGVLAGLFWADQAGAKGLCTAPCDTPFIPADMVTRLIERAGSGGAIALTADGLQPLCALWPVEALDRTELWSKDRSAREVLSIIGAVEVGFEDASAFANLNTQEDYAAAQAAAAHRL